MKEGEREMALTPRLGPVWGCGEVQLFLGKSASVPTWPLCSSSLDAAYTQTALLLCAPSPFLFLYFWLNTGKNVKRNFWAHWRWDTVSLQEGQGKIIFPLTLFSETTEMFGPNKALWEKCSLIELRKTENRGFVMGKVKGC